MKLRLILILCLLIQLGKAQIGRLQLSPLEETHIKIGVTDIDISYSRPSMRERKIFGDLVPYNQWWRTGANRNTTIQLSEDFIIDNQRISKGKYALFTKPTSSTWEVILYKKTDNWNIPAQIDSNQIAIQFTVDSKPIDNTKEVLSITIGDFTNYALNLNIAWENTSVSIPIQLTTTEIMDKKIYRALNGPRAHDYYSAARYEMESGKNYEKGLVYINDAIKVREETSWWDLRIRAIMLMNLGQTSEAIIDAKKALAMAQKENHEFGIKDMSRILQLLEK